MFAFGECGYAAEIPAFAGMEEGEERRKRGLKKTSPDKSRQSSWLCESTPAFTLVSQSKTHSIPAKAGISFSRQREFSAKRNIALFAFGECGFAAEIPAFAGMEGGEGGERGGAQKISSDKSRQWGFALRINSCFHARFQSFSCRSRCVAAFQSS